MRIAADLAQAYGLGLRSLVKQAGFAAIAAGSLASASGLRLRCYSVIHAVIIDPFPTKTSTT
jgi:predicted dinucleotide-binding enzyme